MGCKMVEKQDHLSRKGQLSIIYFGLLFDFARGDDVATLAAGYLLNLLHVQAGLRRLL